jgi:lipopolysaccharide biosynthesis regulator YciM
LAAVLASRPRDTLRQRELAQSLILTDVMDEPNALRVVREYIASDGMLREFVAPLGELESIDDDTLRRIARLIGRVLARGPRYRCGECGFAGQTWFWQCPGCKSWDSLRPQFVDARD